MRETRARKREIERERQIERLKIETERYTGKE